MRIVMGAQSCGFGPVSKLTAISRLLDHADRVFVGTTVAADFAEQNADAYDHLIDEGASAAEIAREIERADWVVSVMNVDLVFSALAAGTPVLLIDSLLAFWLVERDPAEIAEVVGRIRAAGFDDWRTTLSVLTPHEQVFAAHLAATASIAQNFPGVPERIEQLTALGAARPTLSGAIVDEVGLALRQPEPDGLDLLVNIGGFKNFLLDYDTHNEYVRLISRWIPELVARHPQFRRVAVCGGAYSGSRGYTELIGGGEVTFGCLPQREFMSALASARAYLVTPGLTALHESIALGRFPLALPEEHYGHITNLAGLSGTRFGADGLRFDDLIDGYAVPADDFAGTAAIADHVGRLLVDEGAYRRFADRATTGIARYLGLSDQQRQDGVRELRDRLLGPTFAEALREAAPDLVAGAMSRPLVSRR